MYKGGKRRPSGQACGDAEGAAGWPVHRMAVAGRGRGEDQYSRPKRTGGTIERRKKLAADVEINNKSCHVSVTASCSPIWPTLPIVHLRLSFLDTPLSASTQLVRQPIGSSRHGQSIELNNRRH